MNAANSETPSTGPTHEVIPLICNLNAIDAAERDAHIENAGHLLTHAALKRNEREDGFVFHFAGADYERVAAFVANERRCCPFFHFVLDVPPGQAPLTLEIRGNADARALLRAELRLP